MSYNSDYRKNNGPIYVVAAVLAGLVLLANLFTMQTIVSMFASVRYYGSIYIVLYIMVCLLSLAELALMLVLSITVFARASNDAIGKVELATAIVTGIDLTLRLIMANGYLTWQTAVSYAFVLGYQICFAVVIRTRKDVIRKIWFIPGIITSASLIFNLALYGESFRYAFTGFNSIMTSFIKPIVTIGFAFVVMKWASDRIQDRKTTAVAAPATSTANNAPQSTTQAPAAPASSGLIVTCPNCGRRMQPHERFCMTCGTQVQSGFCYSCGAPIIAGSAFCNKCGTKVQN